MTTERCENCRFWRNDLCRRYPRQIVYAPGYHDEFVPLYPEHTKDDWCGEYQPKPEQPTTTEDKS